MNRSTSAARIVSFVPLGEGLRVHVQDADGGTITTATLPRDRTSELCRWALSRDPSPFVVAEARLQLGTGVRHLVSQWMHGCTGTDNLQLPIDP